jgi:hypothetical protein
MSSRDLIVRPLLLLSCAVQEKHAMLSMHGEDEGFVVIGWVVRTHDEVW